MEVLNQRSKSGKTYRIVDDGNYFVHLYCIEFAKVYKNEDGTDFIAWFPLYEPKNKIFTDWDEVKTLFDKLISGD